MAAAAAFALAAACAPAWPLSLGEVQVDSVLDQPLRAMLTVQAEGEDPEALQVRVHGVKPDADGTLGVMAELSADTAGGLYVVLSSRAPLREPILNFTVEVAGPSLAVRRDYTVLVDLPPNPTPATVAGPAAPALQTVQAPPRICKPADEDAQSGPPPAFDPDENRYGPVARGESLRRIAASLRPWRDCLPLSYLVQGLYRSNERAFRGSPDVLKKDSLLEVPGADVIRELGRRFARYGLGPLAAPGTALETALAPITAPLGLGPPPPTEAAPAEGEAPPDPAGDGTPSPAPTEPAAVAPAPDAALPAAAAPVPVPAEAANDPSAEPAAEPADAGTGSEASAPADVAGMLAADPPVDGVASTVPAPDVPPADQPAAATPAEAPQAPAPETPTVAEPVSSEPPPETAVAPAAVATAEAAPEPAVAAVPETPPPAATPPTPEAAVEAQPSLADYASWSYGVAAMLLLSAGLLLSRSRARRRLAPAPAAEDERASPGTPATAPPQAAPPASDATDEDDPWKPVMPSTRAALHPDAPPPRVATDRQVEVRQYDLGSAPPGAVNEIVQLLTHNLQSQPQRADLWLMRFEVYKSLGLRNEFAAAARHARDTQAVRDRLDWPAVHRLWADVAGAAPLFDDERAAAQPPAVDTGERRRFADIALETAGGALEVLERQYLALRAEPGFFGRIAQELGPVLSRPTPLYPARHWARVIGERAGLYLKREDVRQLSPEVENAVAHAQVARMLGKRELVTGNDVDDHALALATIAARFGLNCVVFLRPTELLEKVGLVSQLRLLGADVETLDATVHLSGDPREAALQYWAANLETTYLALSPGTGPRPYPTVIGDFQSLLGREAMAQYREAEERGPLTVVASIGSAADTIGFLLPFLPHEGITLVCTEPEPGAAVDDGGGRARHYQGNRREHAWLRASGRVSYVPISNVQARTVQAQVASLEGVQATLEDGRALAYAERLAKTSADARDIIVLVS
ncbi:MAG: pyridoxal-phosphate dependent enzyme [Gammaproteobacteria bacterium]|nr:pyridoxal-phosphate dependent enzyme [Gammaproteobacteria bacterium]